MSERRTFRVRVDDARGHAYADIEAASPFEAGCAALERFPSAFCAEALHEIEADAPSILRRQAS